MATIRVTHSRLIDLAAQMARGHGMPDVGSLGLPNNASAKLRHKLIAYEDAAHDQCLRWAIRLKQIADELAQA